METLFELGSKHGTDKVDHEYLPHYEKRFRGIQHDVISVLEIGIVDGASLRMWRDYFHGGKIYGIDILQDLMINETRIKSFCGRQEDQGFLRKVIKQTGDLDIVIDDGGHCAKQHVASFEVLWEHVKPGGWYTIEDAITIFNECWTKPDDPTILQFLEKQWEPIIRSSSDIAEVCVIGCGTQRESGRNNGLIFLQKAVKEHSDA